MERRVEVSEFLRLKRANISPRDVGLDSPVRNRRVPGLRREEVAQLAGVSADYYTRLEQGRDITPSESVLDAIANALRLAAAERAHLFDLARPRRTDSRAVQRVRNGLHHLLDTWTEHPAFIVGRRTDVLATNALARILLTDFDSMPARERNFTRWMLLDESARRLYVEWERVAAELVAKVRFDAGRCPDDPRTQELVDELTAKSPEFREWWPTRQVMAHSNGSKLFNHPLVGALEVDYEALTVPDEEEQTIFIYTTQSGSPSEQAMRELARHAAAGRW
ncbi:helix-turn-helix transcriptional regulator [Kibdelosporangium aridum]|uniref:Helix-turn-helix domain-containing protein n=1 Tax=Kibdelosporangium aridum TaxID=2030 RepID=A0A1W1ZG27_KIBAR|nr:helix-turn-helix transcriptional regulator [Kibdelosporangium aridum]SMC47364.1 Helix-turn-helix domain-containing protein [Kibdelosporangium aridum]